MKANGFLVLTSAFVVAVVAGMVLFGGQGRGVAQEGEAWPSFSLTYTTSWIDARGNEERVTRQIAYTSIDEWSEVVLATNAPNGEVGWRQSVRDGHYIVDAPNMETTSDPVSGPTVPNFWLVPGRMAQLIAASGSEGERSDGRVVVSRELETTCVEDVSANCRAGERLTVIETWHFDEVTGIPVRIESHSEDGTLLSTIEVTDLSV